MLRNWIQATLVAAALALTPAAAAAQLQVGLDVDAVFPTNDFLEGATGFGIAGRLGLVLPTGGLAEIVPELKVGYVDFGAPELADAVDLNVVQVMAGARIGFGQILRPTAFAHIGYARLNLGDDDGFFQSRNGIGDENSLAFDVGLALDLVILPIVDVGVHGAYNIVDTDDSLEWWSAGVHAAITF